MKHEYDVVVIGGGAAGLTAAKTAKGLGKKVLIIEKNKLGGECTWTGCVPSKALIRSAEVAHLIQESTSFGLSSFSKATENMHEESQNVMARIKKVIADIYATHTPEVVQKLGIEVIIGNPVFLSAHEIRIQERTIHAKKVIIATGSHPFVPPIEGLSDVPHYTNATFFNLSVLPKKLIILGGGPIGVEMASACNRLGVQVTVIERQSRILFHEDQELVALLHARLKLEGVSILVDHTAQRVQENNGSIAVHCVQESGEQSVIEGDALLVAVGRKPNIHGFGLESTGVAVTSHGVAVDDYMRSSVKNIFACGDVTGPYLFSHMAWSQAVIAARNACIPIIKKKIDRDIKIWATFSAPEIAHFGLTEQEARRAYGGAVTIHTRFYDTLDRAHTDGNTFGMAKVICDSNDIILGVHILGAHAADIIHELYIVQAFNKPFSELHTIIHIYPTYSELLWHMSKKAYVEKLKSRWYIKLIQKVMGM